MARPDGAQAIDLKLVARIDPDKLTAAAKGLIDQPHTVRLSKVQKYFQDHIDDSNAVGAILRWAYFLRTLASRPSEVRSIDDISKSVIRSIASESELEIADESLSALLTIASSDQIYSVWQAQNLSRDAEHLFQGLTIVVDTRAVFDRDRNCVVGEILMPFMKLSFSDGGDFKNISVSLDSSDIETISKELDKLRKKIDVLKARNTNQSVFLVGEEVDFATV